MLGLLVCLSSFVAPPSAVVMRQQLARAAAPSMGLIPERGAANNPRRNGASSTSSVLCATAANLESPPACRAALRL